MEDNDGRFSVLAAPTQRIHRVTSNPFLPFLAALATAFGFPERVHDNLEVRSLKSISFHYSAARRSNGTKIVDELCGKSPIMAAPVDVMVEHRS